MALIRSEIAQPCPSAWRPRPWLAIAAALCNLLVACGATESPAPADDGAASADGLPADVPSLSADVSTTNSMDFVCPGGHGCACASDADCTLSNRCVSDAAGKSRCALPCAHAQCPMGLTCGTLDIAGTEQAFCIPGGGYHCDPCKSDSDCKAPGLRGSACVNYGGAGNFCGVQCLGDGECGKDYRCASVQRAEGGDTQQCVRIGKDLKSLGECGCSARAIAGNLSTTCFAENPPIKCKGSRSCSEAGLSLCEATTPTNEICDGVDNNCNGVTDENLCDDANLCTSDVCDLGAVPPACSHTPTSGDPCSDGNLCTENDTCDIGKCKGGAVSNCDDANPCSDDSCAPKKGCVNAFKNGKVCDDGDPCTKNESCNSGICSGGGVVVCDDKNDCTQDMCGANGCNFYAIDGGVCDDGDPCTYFDTCGGANCAGVKNPCDDKLACTTDSCEAKKGCAHVILKGGCDDGDLCTNGEACDPTGICTGGLAKLCPAGVGCTVNSCSSASGECVGAAKANGSACSDGNACTDSDVCQNGACEGNSTICNDNNACTDDSCDAGKGCIFNKNVGKCDDGNACTTSDLCAAGKCTGVGINVAVVCDDKNVCTSDACDTKLGCANVPKAGNCDDGNACTVGDACDGKGKCVSGVDSCNCTDNSECSAKDDGDLCNGSLTCQNKQCKIDPASVVTCPAGADTACMSNICDGATGKCSMIDAADGKICNDNSSCTSGDACVSGLCKGIATDCDDKNACTDDSCDELSGCKHANNSGGCDLDGNLCTADSCAGGKCSAGAKVVCEAGTDCAPNLCDAVTGKCAAKPLVDGALCSDGIVCTVNDACKTGKCVASAPAGSTALLAGAGTASFNNGKGITATFHSPRGIAVDSSGNIFVADTLNHAIRKVLADGTVTTYTGIGAKGFKDGAPGLAKFWNPTGIAVAADGTMYIADRFNQRIRKVALDGTVTTLAGTAPDPGFGDLKAPGDYVEGAAGVAKFDEPTGIVLDKNGDLIVADTANNRIRKVSVMDGSVTLLAGTGVPSWEDGPALSACFHGMEGLAYDSAGVLYIADTINQVIRVLSVNGIVSTLAGNGLSGPTNGLNLSAAFSDPIGIFAVGADIYVADSSNHRIRKISNGSVTTFAGTNSGYAEGLLDAVKFNEPSALVLANPGTFYVVDALNHRVRKINDPSQTCPPK